jgi:hypothetical protein
MTFPSANARMTAPNVSHTFRQSAIKDDATHFRWLRGWHPVERFSR